MFKEHTIDDFTRILASDIPTPGGGCASALAAATAVSLVSMVASLTIGKKGYEKTWDRMETIRVEMEKLRQFFLEAMDLDADSYREVMDCYKMPKSCEDERNTRKKAIQGALYGAAIVPLQIAEKAVKIFSYAEEVIIKGNKNASSDGAVAALMARASVKGALHNVEINASSIEDLGRKEELLDKVRALGTQADQMERKVISLTEF
ncbi:MAG TPA: cyclodeaminase/cyclohydrolase family protein [Anaerovoracaceae bacterium]|nr:cyclodeaminase/cyclohydrolase family protein [Anaerovoracaceae bacterium]